MQARNVKLHPVVIVIRNVGDLGTTRKHADRMFAHCFERAKERGLVE